MISASTRWSQNCEKFPLPAFGRMALHVNPEKYVDADGQSACHPVDWSCHLNRGSEFSRPYFCGVTTWIRARYPSWRRTARRYGGNGECAAYGAPKLRTMLMPFVPDAATRRFALTSPVPFAVGSE